MQGKIAHSIFLIIFLFFTNTPFAAEEICSYRDTHGTLRTVSSRNRVPRSLRASAKCYSNKKHIELAAPSDIRLGSSERKEHINSSLGNILLRWPRSVEELLGRTPLRAMSDAASTASRALRSASFPPAARNLDTDWEVVFLHENMPSDQIPSYLVRSSRHPAWMTQGPPVKVYVVAERILSFAGVKNGKVSDGAVLRVLLHEIGHAVEHFMTGKTPALNRLQSEGFASWFEQYASKYSSLISQRVVEKDYERLAREYRKRYPDEFRFDKTAFSYGFGSMIFRAIEDRRGVVGISNLYKNLEAKNLSFLKALEDTVGWSEKKILEEVDRILR